MFVPCIIFQIMVNMMYWFTFICVLTIRGAMGNPGGAPASACDSMTPGHGFSVQSGPAPYTITPSSQTYSCGQSVTGTLIQDLSVHRIARLRAPCPSQKKIT